MQDAKYYWDLFLKTGAPGAYLDYKTATAAQNAAFPTNNAPEEKHEEGENRLVF